MKKDIDEQTSKTKKAAEKIKPAKTTKIVKTAKTIKKTKQTVKDKSYFIVLLTEKDLLHVSWKIDFPAWIERITEAEKNSPQSQCLFIDVFAAQDEDIEKIDSIPINGFENKWHIFAKDSYYGKRIILALAYHDSTGHAIDIMRSAYIDIPLQVISAKAGENSILFELSGINLTENSESTSW